MWHKTDGTWVFDVGLHTKNESNNIAKSWKFVSGKRKQQRTKVFKQLRLVEPPLFVKQVKFIRYAPSNGLDDDGLRSAMKSVRDQFMCWLQGTAKPDMPVEVAIKAKADDGPRSGYEFSYDQFRNKEWGVRVEFR